MKRINKMSKGMHVFSLIILGVIICFLSFTAVMYSSIREMRRNYQEAVANGEIEPPSPNAQVARIRERRAAKTEGEAYTFSSIDIRDELYESFGTDRGFSYAEKYEHGASSVINDSDAIMKIERESADRIYYVEATNELVVLSYDGFIKGYYCPKEGKEYFDSI